MGDALELIIAALSGKSIQRYFNDDKVDRMNHLWTVFFLIVMAILTLTNQFVGKPIRCWTPAQFTDAFVDYTNSFCWIKNTYYVPMEGPIPVEINTREEQEITYYQWVPIILLFIAFLYKLPNLLWNSLNDYVGIDIDKVVKMASDTQWEDPETKKDTVNNLIGFLKLWLDTYRPYRVKRVDKMKKWLSKAGCFIFAKRTGNYLTSLYLFIKMVYVINGLCVFFVVNALMSFEFNLYGIEMLDYLIKEGEIKEVPIFPRVTLCDFEIRQLQNIQRFSVQCVLPINLFNEKIFLIVWFWMVVVAAFSIGNLLVWCNRTLNPTSGIEFVKKNLKISGAMKTQEDKEKCRKFVQNYLREDGVFVLRIANKNSSDIVICDIVNGLFESFEPYGDKNRRPPYDASVLKPPIDNKEHGLD